MYTSRSLIFNESMDIDDIMNNENTPYVPAGRRGSWYSSGMTKADVRVMSVLYAGGHLF